MNSQPPEACDTPLYNGTVLIYSINRTEPWWREVARNLGFDRTMITSDVRGDGDFCVVDDFYAAYELLFAAAADHSRLLTRDQVADVIARCRLLRWLPRRQAAAMALAMAEAFDKVLTITNPVAITSFPIDRYVSDVLERLAKARGIPYFELTVSAVPNMSMLLYRGVLVTRAEHPDPALIEKVVRQIVDPLYVPSYVAHRSRFTPLRYQKTFWYFRLRALAFKLISILKRDPLNLHYLDSQIFLGHKPRLSDRHITTIYHEEWRDRLNAFPKKRRILVGLQLFPEASIDYWIGNRMLIAHEEMLIRVVEAFSKAGFAIAIKDHPLQFGFRQLELIHRLLAYPNAIFVPYDISGNEMLSLVDTNFTFTGTMGLQAALLGLKSIVTETYYTNDDDFIIFLSPDEIEDLPRRVLEAKPPTSLPDRQRRIIDHLLRGSFASDFLSFRRFDPRSPNPGAAALGKSLGGEIARMGSSGQAWHKNHPRYS